MESKTGAPGNEIETPRADEPRLSLMINRYDFAMASKAIAGYVEKGYGLDGMPLQRGQSPLSSPREPKNQGGG